MKRIYFGWYVVLYSVLVNMLINGTTLNAFGLYVLPVSKEFGLSRANMNTAIILMNIGGAVIAPGLGWLLDRVAARPVLFVGGIATGLGFTALSLSHSVLFSAVVIGLFLTASEAAAGRSASILIVRWFTANRGRALTFGAMGLSLAGIAVVPIVGISIGHYGWRTTLLLSGVAISVAIFGLGLFVRERPNAEEKAREMKAPARADGAAPPVAAKPIPVPRLLRMPQFWCIGIAGALPMAISQAAMISIVPMAMQAGAPVAIAATLSSAYGLTAISGKFALSVVADRIDRILMLTGVFCFGAIGIGLLAFGHTFSMLLACAGLVGLSSGVLIPLISALNAERFGPSTFGTVTGLMAPITAIMCAVMARFAGEVFDHTGGYDLAFEIFAGLQLLAAAIMFTTRYTSPATQAAPAPTILAHAAE
jgi:MFS family permease